VDVSIKKKSFKNRELKGSSIMRCITNEEFKVKVKELLDL
jgi:hypothetical protein